MATADGTPRGAALESAQAAGLTPPVELVRETAPPGVIGVPGENSVGGRTITLALQLK
jgi:hypothetical protein